MRRGAADRVVTWVGEERTPRRRDLQDALGLTYGGTNKLVEQLIAIGVLEALAPFDTYNRRFSAPSVLEVLLGS